MAQDKPIKLARPKKKKRQVHARRHLFRHLSSYRPRFDPAEHPEWESCEAWESWEVCALSERLHSPTHPLTHSYE